MNAFCVHVLTSCTGSKVSARRPVPAERLYRGQQHIRLMAGIDEARQAGVEVRLSIVSAGHGLVDGSTELLPYEQTFQGKPAEDRRRSADELAIPPKARAALKRPADLHLLLLGEHYLEACDLSADVEPSAPALLFCGAQAALRVAPLPNVYPVALKTEDTRRFECGLVGLKGEVAGRLLRYVADRRPPVPELLEPGLLDRLAVAKSSWTGPTVAETLF